MAPKKQPRSFTPDPDPDVAQSDPADNSQPNTDAPLVPFPAALEVPPTDPAMALPHALARAQWRVRSVAKRGFNTHHAYAYARADDMADECRSALLSEGMVVHTDRFEILPSELAPDESGKRASAILHTHYQLVHPASAASRLFESFTPVVPERGRPIDKALQAAKTMDLSYFLRGLLLVPREADNPDNRNEEPEEEQRGRKPPKRDRRQQQDDGPPDDQPEPKKPELSEDERRRRIAGQLYKRLQDHHGKEQVVAAVKEKLGDQATAKTADGLEAICRVVIEALGALPDATPAPAAETITTGLEHHPTVMAILRGPDDAEEKLFKVASLAGYGDQDVLGDLQELFGQTDVAKLAPDEVTGTIRRYALMADEAIRAMDQQTGT